MRQIISVSEISPQDAASEFSFDVTYTTEPLDETLAGLGLRLHFDSSLLNFNDVENIFQAGFIAQDVQEDTENEDNDPNTDQFLNVAWADVTNTAWPGEGETPTPLFTASFTTASDFLDQTTPLNFTATDTASGYNLEAPSITIEPSGEVGNDIPEIITPADEPFSLIETVENGTEVFTVEATDHNELTFAITRGNTDVDGDGTPAFAIDDEGVVTVQDTDDLEEGNSFNLDIIATDEEGIESDPVTFEVEVTENAGSANNTPRVDNTVFRIEEDLADGEVVGTVDISDSDDGLASLDISISAGNTDVDGDGELPFAIDEQGQITVNDSGDLATEVGSAFSLTVEAVDPLGARGTDSVTVVENNPDEPQPPNVAANVNDIGENEPAGTFVGQASAIDPDGQTEEFEFALDGNLDVDNDGNDVFAINDEGEITVNDTDDLNFEQQESFTFNLTATEEGVTDPLTGQIEVTVGVVEVQEEELSSDFNNDGLVNLDDLGIFASAFGSQQGEDNFNPIAELTGEGLINLDDLGVFASEFNLSL